MSSIDKLIAILRRDMLTAVRHRSGFAVTLIGVLVELAAFYYLSRAIGPGFRPDGMEYFPFLLVGTGVYTFFVMSTQAFLSVVQEAQQTGTLEVLMTTSTPPTELIILSSVSAFAGTLTNLLVYLLAGFAVFRPSMHINLLSCIIALMLSMMIAMALGIGAATVQIMTQKGSAFVWLLASVLWLLSGTMFPVGNLPGPLITLARVVPFTYAIDAMRGALLEGQSVITLAPKLAALAAFGVILLPLALTGLSVSLRQARQNGTLSFY